MLNVTQTGHGIDHRFHPPPNILHYANRRVPGTMKPGMVRSCFASLADRAVLHNRADVRAMTRFSTLIDRVNLGSGRDTQWPDRWTAARRRLEG